jgi:hypothetical protein
MGNDEPKPKPKPSSGKLAVVQGEIEDINRGVKLNCSENVNNP